ncbi:glutamate synthase large subunit [Halanaeroarchaeum sulfurireducens]|uniref:Glutamate synthase large subunit n=1 Tax=Halanaeroarchaeum sulfurireducens TaxID=1604004 RepID=A0A0F7PAD5_9EURY|nr:glutamate synthase large subunit [Halanaeroarchaeum sulfurireducens]AKH96599.1 glutamate synthase large subunit [Halanaeroarchaeum sulfurireducens]ALG81001.1 glutamate synthase large subunit [Halanaeroarchaeum sulfurireducens]
MSMTNERDNCGFTPRDSSADCGVGAVVELEGPPSHEVISDGLTLLENLEHRGATGAEPNTGDGAGILLQTPDAFFRDVVGDLPELYAVGSLFLPNDVQKRRDIRDEVESVLSRHSLRVVEWRSVPTENGDLGETARESEPVSVQPIVVPTTEQSTDEFDRSLYVARRDVEKSIDEDFYVVSLDRQTLVYKGLLKGDQLESYYPDLRDDRFTSAFVLVHARFSTNTLGRWHLAHPYRNVVHNGEINTIQGNINWMRARTADLDLPGYDDEDLDTITPVIQDPDQSDTASLDDALGVLLQGDRDLAHALRMLVPQAWEHDESLPADRRDFYDYHASLIEPWDGPALVVGTDGERVGAVLDRNGLRPCRYETTHDGRVVMSSEQGALPIENAEVEERGRLEPGQLFLADPSEGRIVPDEEVFDRIGDERYGEWVDEHQRTLDQLGDPAPIGYDDVTRTARQAMFGYSRDDLEDVLKPMLSAGTDPIGSMGDDTPLAALSSRPKPLFDFFRQRFAQVTNPPIDYIREEIVTSLETRLGRQRNLLGESPEHARQLVLDSPLLTGDQLAAVRSSTFRTETIDITYGPDTELAAALDRIRERAVAAITSGAEILVLDDEAAGKTRLPIPSLLATGAVHHHLVREGLRTRTGLVVASGGPRSTHHVAALIGYGAGAVYPRLAIDTVYDLVDEPDGIAQSHAIESYLEILEEGLLKVMAKMGISTVRSYQGAQIFDAVGLDTELVDEYFEGTPAKSGGLGLEEIDEIVREWHARAYDDEPEIQWQGEFNTRSDGRPHQWNPGAINALHNAVRNDDYESFEEFSETIDALNEHKATVRSLIDVHATDRDPIPIEAVEPVEDIVERFSTAAMSLGSLSPEMHETNAKAMNELGGKANTGEGGEPTERLGTDKECHIKQVASGRFGVKTDYLRSAEEVQIKMAQGSKPGEGGHLPGDKVTDLIGEVRSATPGVPLISPPPQHDIYSIEDIKQLISDLRVVNPDADVSVKLVSETGVGLVAAGVAKANADTVLVSGHSGGTGASPRSSIKHTGLPWEFGLTEANRLLRETSLRSKVTIRVDGGLKTGRDVAVAALLGAEEFAFGTGSLVAAGCVMARVCHTNDCPTGVATQKENLRERFKGEPEHVVRYFRFIARELREIMADLGFANVEEMIGRVDVVGQRDVTFDRIPGVDIDEVLELPPDSDDRHGATHHERRESETHIDDTLIAAASDALKGDGTVTVQETVSNTDRAVGARLSGRIAERHGAGGLDEDTITAALSGTAGQSFGAFLSPGVTLELEGPANDYVGKGMSGGKICLRTPQDVTYDPERNTLIGNVSLFGATGGELYVNGMAGERFGVRNSGATAVVEGIGDHGCEYMTGGVVLVLGEVGRNFAAGMSGGIAYVYDPDGTLPEQVNGAMVSLSREFTRSDHVMIRRLVENHAVYADSNRAKALLDDWTTEVQAFVKVMPDAYADAIEATPEADVRDDPPTRAVTDIDAVLSE